MEIKLYNTASKKIEKFKPLKNNYVKLYTCGPTVYDYAHIGNLRSYLFEDILKRTLIFNGFKVKHVLNITDVGHLTSDADQGEDKVEVRALKEKKGAVEITQKFTKQFLIDVKRLNILDPDVIARATETIKEQINFIKKLEKKGFTYRTEDGIYFDTKKFPRYTKFARLDIKGLKSGARVKDKSGKKNITDFALWKFSPANKKRLQEWDSPWGMGFPGWHIECSTMSMKYLGERIDIHCGGIEHIPIHHTNEIAQSESLTGKKFVNYWLHNEHLLFNGKKMSKSLGNYATLQDIIDKGFNPLAYRHLVLTSQYRSKLNFTWKSLEASQKYLDNLYIKLKEMPQPTKPDKKYLKMFNLAINNDLDTPRSLALMQELLKSKLDPAVISGTLIKFDQIFGLDFSQYFLPKNKLSPQIKELLNKRLEARKNKNYLLSDKLREEIKKLGYEVKDTPAGQNITKI